MTQRRSLSGDSTSGSDNENDDSRDKDGNLIANTTASTTITTTAILTSESEKEYPIINSENLIQNQGEKLSAVSSSEDDTEFEVILPQKEMVDARIAHTSGQQSASFVKELLALCIGIGALGRSGTRCSTYSNVGASGCCWRSATDSPWRKSLLTPSIVGHTGIACGRRD
jgi:hypothetical protein